jgi:hypothetical protein
MLSIFSKKKDASGAPITPLTWNQEAKDALEQAVSGAKVPKMLRGRMRKELEKAAEGHARSKGKTEVGPHDLMEGLLAKMPAEMRNKVMQAAQQGPEGLERLQKKLQKKNK